MQANLDGHAQCSSTITHPIDSQYSSAVSHPVDSQPQCTSTVTHPNELISQSEASSPIATWTRANQSWLTSRSIVYIQISSKESSRPHIHRRDLVCSTRGWNSSQTIKEPRALERPAAPAEHRQAGFTALPGLSNLADI